MNTELLVKLYDSSIEDNLLKITNAFNDFVYHNTNSLSIKNIFINRMHDIYVLYNMTHTKNDEYNTPQLTDRANTQLEKIIPIYNKIYESSLKCEKYLSNSALRKLSIQGAFNNNEFKELIPMFLNIDDLYFDYLSINKKINQAHNKLVYISIPESFEQLNKNDYLNEMKRLRLEECSDLGTNIYQLDNISPTKWQI